MFARVAQRASRLAATSSRVAAITHTHTQPHYLAPPQVVPCRNWFGFGMPHTTVNEVPQPWYSRETFDDSADFETPMSEAELRERQAMASQIKMLSEDSAATPNHALYESLIKMLIKWDDRHGVRVARNLALESGVELGAQFDAEIDSYLLEKRADAYHTTTPE